MLGVNHIEVYEVRAVCIICISSDEKYFVKQFLLVKFYFKKQNWLHSQR